MGRWHSSVCGHICGSLRSFLGRNAERLAIWRPITGCNWLGGFKSQPSIIVGMKITTCNGFCGSRRNGTQMTQIYMIYMIYCEASPWKILFFTACPFEKQSWIRLVAIVGVRLVDKHSIYFFFDHTGDCWPGGLCSH